MKPTKFIFFTLFFFLQILSGCSNLPVQDYYHPLDPLVPDEYQQTILILKNASLVDDDSKILSLEVLDPPKNYVKSWTEQSEDFRQSFTTIRQSSKIFEVTINLNENLIISIQEIENVQPSLIIDDFINSTNILLNNELFIEALIKRNLTKNQVACAPMTLGNYNNPSYRGRRLLKTPCYVLGEGSRFTRPIEGIYAVVDLDAKEVFEFIDYEQIPIANNNASTSVISNRPSLKETIIYQPNGSNINVNGHLIKWDNWSFHYRMEKRSGLMISNVFYQDGNENRSIMYQGSLSELFVPYMDPDQMWFSRTFLDAGEYGFGASATPLKPGVDCPNQSIFLSSYLPDDFGNPYLIPNSVCLFERNNGDPAWRHFENDTGYEGKAGIELIVRMAATIGNYDYFTDWVFTQDGRIKPRIGASGYDGYKGVVSQSVLDEGAEKDTQFGTLVAPNLVGINHDHFFSFRLDLDIDGIDNSLSIDRLDQTSFDGPRSGWSIISQTIDSELDAMIDYNPSKPANWRFINPNRRINIGHNPGYILRPLNSVAINLMDAEDPARKRAGFTDHQLWVTPYKPDEKYAAGIYVNQGDFDMGLPQWTSSNRDINNEDIVVWYSAGFHHAPRVEDFPIMPFAWHEFELMPYNFFNKNPALDITNNWSD
jgi:primary-amine oxidase